MGEPAIEVRWTESAVRDLLEIMTFVAADSPLDAERLLDRLQKRAATLVLMPLRGRVPPELVAVGFAGVRELLERPYRLVYRVERSVVTVMAVFDGRRDLADVLLDRLLRT